MMTQYDAVSLTRQLVRIPSESSEPIQTNGSAPEAAVAELLRAICRDAGLPCTMREALDGRHNLMVRLPKPGAPRIVMTAHMDTVSAHGMENPFAGLVRDGKIFGRGACDDKGPLAASLATLLQLHHAGTELAYDVTFVATVDEECSMAGAEALAAASDGWDLCIALEPTDLKIVRAHKGVYRFRVRTQGLAAHSSSPELGRNAIHAMLPLICDLRRYGDELARRRDAELGRAHLSITRIEGGGSINIIPDQCAIGVDIRILPGMEPAEIAKKVRECVGDRGTVEEIFQGLGIDTDPASPLIVQLQEAISAEGLSPLPVTAAYATDCSKLAHKGPCIVWGPGSIAQAHKQDEFIAIKQLESACRILSRFLSA